MKYLLAIVRRTAYVFLVLMGVIVLNFTLIHLAPGDPIDTMVGEMGGATEEVIARLRSDFGLDKSPPMQLAYYIQRMARLDLGMSFHYNLPVKTVILKRIPATLLLVLSALFIAIILGTFLGTISAQKPGSLLSHLVTLLSLMGFSAPVFWTGMMLLLLFSSLFPLFPSFGMQSISFNTTTVERGIDILHHLFLPSITLASIYLALYSRIARASMLDVLGSDYIRTARSKGLRERTVIYRHALKNALLPVLTMAGLQFSNLIAGAVVVETVFSWPGMGQLAFESILRRDHNLLLGILFFSTMMVVSANILTDLFYRWLDPRIK